jgi:hypothetical protein
MTYKIKTYEPGFEVRQAEIGREIVKDWIGAAQTPADNLKNTYSAEKFDPETRLYAFYNDEIVGFLTSTVEPPNQEGISIARLEFPIVLPEHVDAEKILIDTAEKVLKQKNVSVLMARASELWGNTTQMAEKYQYSFDHHLNYIGMMNPSELESKDIDIEIQEYKEEFLPLLKNMFLNKMGLTEEQFTNQINFINSISERIISWKVIIRNGEMIGNSVVTRSPYESTTSFMANIAAFDDDQDDIRRKIFDAHVSAIHSNKINKLILYYPPQFENLAGFYQSLGFNTGTLSMYKKLI